MKKPLLAAAVQMFCIVKTGIVKSKGFLTIILLLFVSSFSIRTNKNQQKENQQFFDELHPLVDYFEYSTKQYASMLVTDRTLWFKADAGVLTGASSSVNGETITVWQDQEGGDNNGIQAVVHAGESGESSHLPGMPAYVYTGNDHFNFNPLLRFDRTANGNRGEAVEFATPSRNDQTVFVVFKNIIGFNSFSHWAQPPLYGNDISSPGNLANEGLPTNTNHADIAFTYTANNNLAVGGGFSGDFNLRGNLNLNSSGKSQGVIGVFSRNSIGNNSVEFFLYANGSPESSASSPFSTGNTGSGYPITTPIRIGKHNSNDSNANSNLDGDVAEVLTYDRVLSATERHEVESYLAIKYGITLNGNQDQLGVHQGNENYNYIDSDGNPIWNTDANYKFDIAGLGADSGYNLNQKISKSINPNAIVAMAIDTDFSEGNLKVRASITDKEFLIWGNDAAGLNETTTEVPSPEATHRLPREWRVQKTGNSIGNVSVQVDLSSASHGGNVNTLYLMVDTDNDGDFTTGTIEYFPASSYTSDIVQFDDVSFEDNNVFAIATQAVVMVDPCDPASGNLDSDGDGLADVCDQDDDNDGILDVNECELSTATFSSTTTTTGNLTLPNSGGTANWNISNTGQTSIVSSGVSDNNELYFVYTGNSGWNLTSDFEITNVPAGANVQLRLDGFVDKTGGGFSTSFGARFSTYTISWVGGAGDAVVYDPRGDQIVGGQQNLANGDSFTQDAGNKSNGAWNNDLLEWYVVFPAGATQFTIQAQGGSGLEGFRFSAVEVFCDDFDKDGTPNYLDTDSDNDGCPDAIDGAGAFTLGQLDTDLEISGNISSTTGIPEDAGNGQGVGSAYNAGVTSNECDDDGDGVINGSDICNGFDDAVDTDGDTVPDGCDQDSDNDGILDTDETFTGGLDFTGATGSGGSNVVVLDGENVGDICPSDIGYSIVSIIADSGQSFAGNDKGSLRSRFISGNGPGVKNEFELRFTNETKMVVSYVTDANKIANGQFFTSTEGYEFTVPVGKKITLSDPDDQLLIFDGTTYVSGVTTHTAQSIRFRLNTVVVGGSQLNHGAGTFSFKTEKIDVFNIKHINFATTGGGDNTQFNFAVEEADIDCDNDGTPNHLDLDSDADGCPDALEGAENFAKTDLVDFGINDRLDSAVELNTTSPNYGVPTISGSPQGIGTSIDAAVSSGCDIDLDLDKSVDNSSPREGETVTFTIQINNASTTTAVTGVEIKDVIPVGLENISAISNGGTLAANTITWASLTIPTSGLTLTYTADIKTATGVANEYKNIAQITASDIGDPDSTVNNDDGDQSEDDEDSVILTPMFPGIELTKTLAITANAGVAGLSLGDVVSYTFVATNTGNVTLTNISIDDTFTDANGNVLTLGAITFDSATGTSTASIINVGESSTFTAIYTITQSDVDAGGITNTAMVRADAPGGNIANPADDITDVSDDDDDTDGNTSDDPTVNDITQTPELTVLKAVTTAGSKLGDIIAYDISVTNSGDVTVTNIAVTDANADAGSITYSNTDDADSDNDIDSLAPGASATVTVTQTITQAHVDAGLVVNSATATGKDPNNNDVSDVSDAGTNPDGTPVTTPEDEDTDGDASNGDDNDPTGTTLVQNPALTVLKTVTTAGSKLGDVIGYDILVTNSGDVTVTNIAVTDTNADTGSITYSNTDDADSDNDIDSLAPGASATVTVTQTITQAHVDAGLVVNSATATGKDPNNNDVTDTSDAGTNPDGTPVTTPEDEDTDGDASNGDDNDPTGTTLVQTPALTVLKTVTTAGSKLGDVIGYDILVTNSGDVTVTNIVVTDTNADAGSITYSNTDDADSDNDIDSLAPGASVTVTVTQTITQAHVDAGLVVNSATATGKDPNNNDVTDTSDAGTNPDGTPVTTPADEDTDGDESNGDDNDPTGTTLVQNPALTVLKTVTTAGTKLGDVIGYDILVTNSGDVTITNIAVTDANADAGSITYSNTDDADSDNDIDSLAPGASATVTVTQTITQGHVDAGLIVNSATATGKDPNNNDVTDTSDAGTNPDGTPVIMPEDEDTDGDTTNGDDNDPTGTTLSQNPALTVLKTVTTAGTKLGDVIGYDILVTNSGDVTVTNIAVTDANADAGNITYSNTDDADSDNDIDSLAPGASVTVTVTQTITQAHVDAGLIVNSATATGKDPNNTDVTDTSDAGTNPDGTPVTTPEDEDTDGDASNGDDDDPTGTTLVQNPVLTVLKTVTTAGTKLGDVIGYDILVTNSGDVTVTNIAVTDANADAGSITYSNTDDADSDNDIDSLAPGASATVTVTQTITQAHVDAGLVVNSATATGKDPNNTDVTDTSDAGTNPDGTPVTTPADEDTDGDASNGDDNDPTGTTLSQNPALTVLKTVTTAGTKLGDVIGYDILVTNSGDVTVTNIAVTDANADAGSITYSNTDDADSDNDIDSLTPGASAMVTVTQTITQAHVDAGLIVNSATATGKDPNNTDVTDTSDAGTNPDGTPVTTPEDEDTDGDASNGDDNDPTGTTLVQTPALTVLKTVTTAGSKLGDVIAYDILVTNSGDVTVTNIAVTDANADAGSITYSNTDDADSDNDIDSLTPGASAMVTVTQTITQAHVDAGLIVNSATATGKDPNNTDVTDTSDAGTNPDGTPVTTPEDEDTDGDASNGDDNDPTGTTLVQTPALTVLKTVTTAGSKLGDVIAYDILVTNSGDVTVTNIAVTDANADAGSITYSNTDDADSDNDIDSLAPGASAMVTVTQTITQAHVDAGLVVNSATATGKDPNNTDVTDISDAGTNPDGTPVIMPEDEDTDGDASNGDDNDPTGTTLVQNPALTVLKTVTTAGSKLGDIIAYDILVTNSGDVTVTNIAVTDTNADTGSITYSNTDDADSDNDIDSLAPGAIATVTVTQTITQAHVDAGLVVNSATATGKDPNSTDVTDTSDAGTNPDGTLVTTPEDEDTDGDASNGDDNDPTGTTLVQNPALTVLKTVTTAGSKLGDVIGYDILVTNSGDVTVTNIVVTDTNADAGSITYSNTDDADSDNDIDSLAPGASVTVTVTQTITQAHVDAGLVINSAMATGKDPNNNDVSDVSDAGTNPDGTSVTDPDTEDTDGDTTNGDDNDPTGTTLVQNPALTVLKTVTTAGAKLGDVIGYDILVTNSGDVTVTNIVVTDTNADAGSITYSNTDDADSDNDIDSLAPGASATVTVTQTITQAHVDAGLVINSAMATGKDPNNNDVSDVSDAGTNPDGTSVTDPDTEDTDGDATNGDDNDPTGTTLSQNPALTVLKTVTTAGAKLGDVIGYDILVTNSGDVTVTNIVVTDTNADAGSITYSNTDDADSDNDIDSLVPGASATVTVTQTITQAHVDAGLIVNSATATGKDPNNTDVTDISDAGTNPDGTAVTTPEDEDTDGDTTNGDDNDPTGTTLSQNPELTVLKAVTTAGAKLGDIIAYDILVTNSGDVTVTNIAVTDANADAGSITYSNTDDADSDNDIDSLAPGASATVTVMQTITQAHVDAGLVVNSATATGKDPNNTDVTDISDAGTNPDGTPVATPEDEDTDGDASNGDDDDPTTTDLTQTPEITLEKSFSFTTGNGSAVGDVLTYSLVVTNTGNVTIDNVSITDAKLGLTNEIVTPSTLAPGVSATLIRTYTITQADLNAGEVVNTAVAEGTDPKGNNITDISDAGTAPDGTDVTTPEDDDTDGDASNGDDDDSTISTLIQTPVLVLEKSFAFTSGTGNVVGDVIEYTFEVTNTGNVTVDNISITDAKLGMTDVAVTPSTLNPGESTTLTANYTVTQADLDAGEVVNTAVAEGTDPKGNNITDTSDAGTAPDGTDVTTPEDDDTDGDASNGDDDDSTISTLIQTPVLVLEKSFAFTSGTGNAVGDVIEYTFEVTNTGNVTVDNISITDAKLGMTDVAVTPSTLNPGESTTLTANYTVTQADLDTGEVVNTAVAEGTDPKGNDVSDASDAGTNSDGSDVTTPEDEDTDGDVSNGDDDDDTISDLIQDPAITVVKTIVDANTQVGGEVTYRITVTNTGNITVNTVRVTDAMLGLTNEDLTPSTLAPEESAFIESVYTITQADMDRGYVENTASGSAVGVNGDAVNDISDTDIDADGNGVGNHEEVDSPDGEGNTDGDSGNDVTVLTLEQEPSIMLTKNAEYVDIDGNLYVSVGDVINYTFEVINTGNVTLTNITVEDTMLVSPYGEITGGPIASLMVGETDTTTFTGTYQIQQSDIDRGWVENTAEAIGFDADGIVEVNDVSDTGTKNNGDDIDDPAGEDTPDQDGNTDGDAGNDPTITVFNKDTCLTIYNEFSPNDDKVNDYFEIDCIESYPGNTLEIFNRWGNTVYKTKDYDNSWNGTSNGRATINGSDKLPVGTYYYVLDLNDGSKPKTGWLYLNR